MLVLGVVHRRTVAFLPRPSIFPCRSKNQKLLKQMKFPEELSTKVDPKRVNMKVIKDWVGKRVIQLLGFEDDVVVGCVEWMLQDPGAAGQSLDTPRAAGSWRTTLTRPSLTAARCRST